MVFLAIEILPKCGLVLKERRVLPIHSSIHHEPGLHSPDDSSRCKETVRRDLFRLEDRGLLRKVHGGAVRAQTAAKAAFSLRLSDQAREKQLIAETAAGLFQRGDSLVLFSGTTTMALATVLARESGLTFVTNSVDIAANLWRGPGAIRSICSVASITATTSRPSVR